MTAMKNSFFIMLATLLLVSCGQRSKMDQLIQGKTEKEQIAVVGKVAGRIQELKVSEGQPVKKGDTLAILDIPEVAAKQAQAEGALTSATAQYDMAKKGASANQLQQLNDKKNALYEQYIYAEKSLKRLGEMVKDSLIPQQQYDEVYAKYQGAKAQYSAVKSEIADVENGVRIEQQTMALGQQERAKGAVQEVMTANKERFIIAPQDMVIESITLKVGELAAPGYTLFLGTLNNATYFRFTVPESQLKSYEKGAHLTVTVPYQEQRKIETYIKNVKQIGAYANIATAYPDYDMQDPLYEIIAYPKNATEAAPILNKTTVTIKKSK